MHTHTTREINTYTSTLRHSPNLIISTISSDRVENVVKPPQNPTTAIKYIALLDSTEAKIPIKNDPMILTDNVPSGTNDCGINISTDVDTRNLNMLPKKPPRPTSKTSLNIIKQ